MGRRKGMWGLSKWLGCLLLLLVCEVVHAGTVYLDYTDPQGNVLAVADVHGNIIARYDYRPYGSPIQGAGPNGPGYAGHVNDPETGLVNMQQRYYDPYTGRFLSPDPIEPSAGSLFGFNRYDYANNNPVVNVDPDGRETGIAYHSEFVMMGAKAQTYTSPNDPVGPAVMVGMSLLPVVGDGINISNAVANPSPANVAAAVVGAVPVVGNIAADVIKGTSAAERATAIAGTMGVRTQRAVTIAVTETKEGVRVISSSEGALRPAARAALSNGEVAAKGAAGTHAEVNGISAARDMGLTPTGTAASRPICSSCAHYLEQQEVKPLSPLKQ